MDMPLEQEWKKGSAELLILSLFSRTSLAMVTISGSSSKAARGASCGSTSPRCIRCSTGSRIAAGFRDVGSKNPIKEGGVTTV